jgi:hypothetical protein
MHRRSRRAIEQVEDARQHLRCDADPIIADPHHDFTTFPPNSTEMRPAGSVDLAALLSRLTTTCSIRVGSLIDRSPRACGDATRRGGPFSVGRGLARIN